MKKLIFLATLVTLIQITVTFFTSNMIVSTSLEYHQNQKMLETLKKDNSTLLNQYLSLISIDYLKSNYSPQAYFPITKNIDLTK